MTHESEVAVLSLLLTEEKLDADFPVDYFSSEVHKNIYRIIQEIKYEGKVVDPYLIRLIAEKNSINIGGDNYLDILISNTYPPANFQDYLADLESAYKQRVMFDLSLYIRDALHDGYSIDKITDTLKREIDRISSLGKIESCLLSEGAIDFAREVIEESKTGKLPGNSIGFSLIDNITSGIRGGNLWIIAGRPGMGKSSFMLNSIRNTDYVKDVYSLEMSKKEFLEREFAMGSKVPLLKIRSRALSDKEANKIISTAEQFNSRKDILLHEQIYGISALERSIRKNKKEFNTSVVHIDYAQLLVERDAEATHALGRMTRKLKRLARELDIGIVLYSQLNRNVETRDDKRPILPDLRQSGNLEEDADLVVFLYRDEYYHKDTKDKGVIEFIIAKQRQGPTGTLFLKFDKDTTTIYEE